MDHGEKMFKRGHGWHGTTVSTSLNYGGVEREGTLRAMKDQAVATYNLRTRRTGGDVQCIAVRNSQTAFSLLPKRLVRYASGFRYRRVDGYANTTAYPVAGVMDEYLPAGGLQPGDLGWMQVRGPTLTLTDLAADSTPATFSEGGKIVAMTAASSGATTAGRISVQTETSSISHFYREIQNAVGVAMSANTSNGTNRSVLVNLELL